MERLIIALVALLGGMVAALVGWLDSKEPFDVRKFGGSSVRSLIAGIVFAVGYHLSGAVSILDLFYAFLGGAGVDVLGNRIAVSLGNGNFPVSQNRKPTGEEDSQKPKES